MWVLIRNNMNGINVLRIPMKKGGFYMVWTKENKNSVYACKG